MANFSQTHPAMAAKIMDHIESGMDPSQIIQAFMNEDEANNLEAIEGKSQQEQFPSEILIISQALAYRDATIDDSLELYSLLNNAYSPEVVGDESFRIEESVSLESIKNLFLDRSYKWTIVEAPSGKGVEIDGVILGAACYSVDGFFKYNGINEGALGSIRFLGVLPRYRGFCVGRRLLEKIENIIFYSGCCKTMVSIPNTRISMLDWIERRGYIELGSIPYPDEGICHTLKENKKDTQLIRYIKSKEMAQENICDATSISKKNSLIAKSVLSINCISSEMLDVD